MRMRDKFKTSTSLNNVSKKMIFGKGLIILWLVSSGFGTLGMKKSGRTKKIKSTTHKSTGRYSYTFPEIHEGNDALQPTLQLLQLQKKHLEEVQQLFQKVWVGRVGSKKGPLDVDSLQTVDGNLIHIGAILNDTINTITGYLKNADNVTDGEKMEPLNDISSWMLLHLWETINDWSNNEFDPNNLDDEICAMREPLLSAIHEMKAYRNYSTTISNDALKLANSSIINEHNLLFPRKDKGKIR